LLAISLRRVTARDPNPSNSAIKVRTVGSEVALPRRVMTLLIYALLRRHPHQILDRADDVRIVSQCNDLGTHRNDRLQALANFWFSTHQSLVATYQDAA
jgi:hypothetical protein